ncbi:hypothetical protein AGMMS49975_05450 [Clostridia bacterium]|nr:hypothetical protein AGMMS49975_05450 [Clostridia bacterium]
MYYIGIDASGTYMRLVAATDDMRVIGRHTSKKDETEGKGGVRVRENIRRLLFEFNKFTNTMLTDCAGLCFGSNSADSPEKSAALKDALAEIIGCKATLVNNAQMSISAHTRGGAGIAVYAGSSVSGFAVTPAGDFYTCGSYGTRLTDAGTAGIGLAAVKYALKGADKILPKTALSESIPAYLKTPDIRGVIDLLHNGELTDDTISGMSLLVKKAALAGDAAALEIESIAASELAQIAVSLIQKNEHETPLIVTTGVVFETIPQIFNFFMAHVKQRYPKANITMLKEKLEMGALYLAIQKK